MKEWFEHLIPKDRPIETNRPVGGKAQSKLERDIEKYLSEGGGIHVVPQGATGQDYRYENGKRTRAPIKAKYEIAGINKDSK